MVPGPLIELVGQPPSVEIRAQLAAEGLPVLLAFSRGKDSIAAWLALEEAGCQVIPYHMYLIPDLGFVRESLGYFERFFGQKIVNVPHPSLYRWLRNGTFQPPERMATIEAADFGAVTFEDVIGFIREDYDLSPDTWIADGVRAADSPVRRMAFATHGVMKPGSRKVSVVWDWRKAHVLEAMAAEKVEMPPEYEWFGRSFDGVDARFLAPLREHRPEDYQLVLNWLPLADLGLFRAGL